MLRTVLALEQGVAWASRPHQARIDGGDHDTAGAHLRGEALGEAGERELAGAVREQVRHGDLPADGDDVDDAAVTARAQERHCRERNGYRAPEVRPHGVLEIGVREGVHRPDADGARVVDEDVEAAEVRDDALDEGACLRGIVHVRGEGKRRDATTLEIDGGAVERLGVAGADRHARPPASELPGELQAEPAGAAGDERNPAAQRDPAPSPGPKAEGRAEGETDERETPMAHGECLLRPCWGAHPCNCKAGCDR